MRLLLLQVVQEARDQLSQQLGLAKLKNYSLSDILLLRPKAAFGKVRWVVLVRVWEAHPRQMPRLCVPDRMLAVWPPATSGSC